MLKGNNTEVMLLMAYLHAYVQHACMHTCMYTCTHAHACLHAYLMPHRNGDSVMLSRTTSRASPSSFGSVGSRPVGGRPTTNLSASEGGRMWLEICRILLRRAMPATVDRMPRAT